MTAFDPIPFPNYDVLADFPPYTVSQGVTLDGNFGKVNSYLQGVPLTSAPQFARNLRYIGAYLAGNNAVDFAAADWPSVTFTVPECSGMFVYVAAEINCGPYGGWVGCMATGSGPGMASPGELVATFTGRQNRYATGGTARYFPRTTFVVGQQLTLTPRCMAEIGGNYYFDLCEMGCVPVR